MKQTTKHTTVITSDEPVSVHVDDSSGHWFRLFRAIVRGGAWAVMTPACKAVYVVLAESVNDEIRRGRGEWIAWPSIPTIAKSAGLADRNVYRAIVELERTGLLKRRASGGGRSSTTYQLTPPPLTATSPLTAASGQGARQRQGTPDTSVTQLRLNGLRLNDSSRPSRSKASPSRNVSAAAADVMEALSLAEIGEPVRSELAARPGITAAMVQQVSERARNRGKGSGVIVSDLRAKLDAGGKRKAIVGKRRQLDDQAATERATEAKRIRTEQQAVERTIMGLSDAELRKHTTAVLAAMPATSRRLLESADPRRSATLKAAIYQRVST